ncbi:SpoIIE family protein phosphatase [Streptomyces sp. Je 1-4]|uniref:SpoIIE family protein phosphatase/ATP-binding protein n=1 Tax=Streptomyces TaxID=1883 RepID=UPI0021D8C025|nr:MULTISPECIES: SpoIIE family protein phosphatase/ATP-binding protein [unclassified Streptomyces]UYB37850.1 SpoIIE family protein phosphatase [Streptomyces sp. Je 1-4]UZQ33771.1 SpoIIE family protein phosphatase [Streptomyces sp. Je 1-4] [Streptomyces sp. Je 1-4 4N24]UZQ41189.1 SpoIIE family protein phosphatase [Streptomyces sp. Je 1-4] [Streptomyces sp. Je 1-4 4N24_ara]
MRSVAREVFLLQLVLVVLLVAAAVVALVVQARRDTMTDARHRTLAAAESFAHSWGLQEALNSDNPTAKLQPLAEAARKASGVDALIVYKLDGITLTHSDPRQIGKHVIGPYAEAARGKPFTRTFEGALGLSVVSAAPVKDPSGRVIALVAAPVTVEKVQKSVNRQLPLFLATAVGALALAGGGAGLVSRRLRRQTHGLGPVEMTRMYEHHDAVLHAVREGVLIVGRDGRLLLVNDEARRLLDLPADAEGRHVGDLGLDRRTAELLASDRTATDEVHLAQDRLLAVNKRSTSPYGAHQGSVVTLRDTTELRWLSGRAEVARERLRLLYDAGTRIGSTLNVVRTAEELAQVAVPRFADIVTVELLDPVLKGEEPAVAGTELRRTAIAGLTPDHPLHPVGELLRFIPGTPVAAGVDQVRSVVEPDLAGSSTWRSQDPERARRILDHGVHSLAVVPLRARGVVLGLVDFWRSGDSPPFDDEDRSFAEELAGRAAVGIDNARRYTRERTMAMTLQRSLMPRGLPDQDALEVAHRYLPAKAGVGGDWFDVIPLPGARVALVVGDVVGHGLHAAATMGRLRIAVHNFSALDLSPDELLGHLDELVTHIDVQDEDTEEGPAITGATCLYVVYDSVSGRVTAATAGHLPPAVAHPDGRVEFLHPPVSPPLGLGTGLPFETTELSLPEGSRLVLYTDGLVENRSRDLDAGLEALRAALSGPDRTPEDTCSTVMESLLPARSTDDVALLVARTRRLDPAHVAEWDVPRDPAGVGPVRNDCVRRLADWGLQDIAFGTELILSELITNAIRYGAEPIHVRLLHTRSALISEVSDGSSTSPHIRQAKATDEDGRGLFLVAQFAEHWGTRYSPRGKTIWAAQAVGPGVLPSEEESPEHLLSRWEDGGEW